MTNCQDHLSGANNECLKAHPLFQKRFDVKAMPETLFARPSISLVTELPGSQVRDLVAAKRWGIFGHSAGAGTALSQPGESPGGTLLHRGACRESLGRSCIRNFGAGPAGVNANLCTYNP